jgi:hypothetical protein
MEELLARKGVPNAAQVAALLRERSRQRGFVLDHVFFEEGLVLLDDGRVRLALGGMGSVLITPATLEVSP